MSTAGYASRAVAGLPPEALVPTLALAAALLLGAVIIVWMDRWRKRGDQRAQATEADLDTFHALHQQGQLSHEELERIRARLGTIGEPDAPQTPSGPTDA